MALIAKSCNFLMTESNRMAIGALKLGSTSQRMQSEKLKERKWSTVLILKRANEDVVPSDHYMWRHVWRHVGTINGHFHCSDAPCCIESTV